MKSFVRSSVLLVLAACAVAVDQTRLFAEPLLYTSSDSWVSVFSMDGTLVKKIGEGHVNVPEGIAFDSSGNMYVANNFGNSIGIFSPDGQWLRDITSAGHLSSPHGLLIDGQGNLYAANQSGNNITVFNSAGIYQKTITGTASNTPNGPVGMSFDGSGNLWVASPGTTALLEFNPAGTQIGQRTLTYSPWDVAIDPSSGVYYTSDIFGQSYVQPVRKYDSDGTLLGQINGLDGPEGIALDSNGFMFIAANGTNEIYKYTTDLVYVSKFSADAPHFVVIHSTSAVPEIDPAGMGSVLVLVTGALGLLEHRRLKVRLAA